MLIYRTLRLCTSDSVARRLWRMAPRMVMVSHPICARCVTAAPTTQRQASTPPDRMEDAGDALGRTVLACLAQDLAPAEAYERLVSVDTNMDTRSLHTCLSGTSSESYSDVLVRLALRTRPPPPRLFTYIETMCVYRMPSMSVEEYDERGIVVSLLSQLLASKPADHVAVDAMAHLILEAGGHAHVLEHLPTKQLIEAFGSSTCDFWRATLRLVCNPSAAGAQLFTRLVQGALRDGWPSVRDEDNLNTLLTEIQDVLGQMDAINNPQSDAVRHALASLQHGVSASADDLFDEEMPKTPLTKLCNVDHFSAYTSALVQAWRQSKGSGRCVPPQAPPPEPAMVLLVHTLARLDMDWAQKSYTALGMLRMRCAHAAPRKVEGGCDMTCMFLHELIVATTLCAIQELGADPRARTAQSWRHVLGGVVRFLNLTTGAASGCVVAATCAEP